MLITLYFFTTSNLTLEMPRFWFWYVPCMQSWQLREPCISCAVPWRRFSRPISAADASDMEMGEGFECNMGIVHGNFPFQGGFFLFFDSHILGNEATKTWFIILWTSIPHLICLQQIHLGDDFLSKSWVPNPERESHPPKHALSFPIWRGRREWFFGHPKNPLALCTRLAKEGGDIVISLAAVTLFHTF